jgi:general secretion pathway protein B
MSYILDALRKAERERTRGVVPGLDAQQAEAPPLRSRRAWPLWIGFALLVNAVVLGWLMWPQAESPSAPAASAMAPVIAKTPTAPVAPVPVAPAAPTPPTPVAEQSPEVAAVPEPAPPAAAEPAAIPEPEQSAGIAEDSAAVPLWNELSPGQRAALPKVTVDVHVYADDPGQRFVLINMRRYMEGERLPEGPTLDTITEDGVILSHNGVRYRLERQ